MALRSAPPPGELLRQGDPITIVYRGSISCILLLTHVTKRDTSEVAVWIEIQLPRTVESLELSDEGHGWVRGHHLIDSPAVDAARVAQGL